MGDLFIRKVVMLKVYVKYVCYVLWTLSYAVYPRPKFTFEQNHHKFTVGALVFSSICGEYPPFV